MHLSLQVEGQEQVGGTYRAPSPPGLEAAPEAGEAAAGEGGPADEEEAAQDTASPSLICSLVQIRRDGVMFPSCCMTCPRVLQGVPCFATAASLLFQLDSAT